MSAVTDLGWTWDPSLYEGASRYYPRGRIAYPAAVVETVRRTLELDGTGVLLDVGCGPGSLTIPLAPLFERAVGVDADTAMLVEADRQAHARGVDNITWRRMRAEELPADLGVCRVVTFAQSFHWFDRARVAMAVRSMLQPLGACVHVAATTHQGVDDDRTVLPNPRPPRAEITELIRRYLGSIRRAGRSSLPDGTFGDEAAVYGAAGFLGPQRIEVPGAVVTRTADEIVASVFSLSSAAPHLFGDRVEDFERDLRALLHAAGPADVFDERMREIALDFWRPVG